MVHPARIVHRHWDRARPCHICTGTGLTPPKSAPKLCSLLSHLHLDWARIFAFAATEFPCAVRSLAATSLALLHSCSKHGVVTDLLENDVVVDGRIVTGQNQMGSCQVSQLLMQMVQSRKVSA